MGWTSYHATHYKNGKVDRKAECDKLYNSDAISWTEDRKVIGKYEVLKSSMVGTTYYAAVKKTIFATKDKPENIQVFGTVCLTSTDVKDYYNFAYKDMDETCGPCKYDCPKGILDLLTPTESEYANEWRKQCYEHLDKKKKANGLNKLPVGSVIKVVMPFDTNYFTKGQEVKLQKHPKWGSNRTQWITQTPPMCRFVPTLMKLLEECYEVVQKGEENA